MRFKKWLLWAAHLKGILQSFRVTKLARTYKPFGPVLSDAINEMSVRGVLSTRWQVTVTFSDDANADTTFSLEPGADAHGVGLERLQSDIATISAGLEAEFNRACEKLSPGGG